MQVTKINLAQEPDCRLGGIQLSPSRGIVSDGAVDQRVAPQVMQVLLVLLRADGQTVTRDALVDACWDGRIVSDDAINRVIALLRGLARQFDPPPFHLQTIPKIGFRLNAAEPQDSGEAEPPPVDMPQLSSVAPQARTTPRRRVLIGAAGAAVQREVDGAGWWAGTKRLLERAQLPARRGRLLLGLAALAVLILAAGVAMTAWWMSRPVLREPSIALAAFSPLSSDVQADAFAKRLTDDVAGVLNENITGLAPPGPDVPAKSADLRVGGSAQRDGDTLRVRAYLEDGRTGLTLWSRQYQRPAREEEQLRTQVAVDLSDTLINAMEPLQQTHLAIDSRTMSLWLSATGTFRQGFTIGDGLMPARAFEQVVERAPRFANARGMMAQGLALAARDAPLAQTGDLRRRARAEAERALRTDPVTAEGAYDALFWLARVEAPDDLARAEDVWIWGLSRSPNSVGGLMRRCELLMDLGRARTALSLCERAAGLRPLGAPWGYRYARALAAVGQTENADRVIAREVRLHPQHYWIRKARFQMKAFGGPPSEALALLHDTSQPPAFTANEIDALQSFLRARTTGSKVDADRAVAKLRLAVDRGQLGQAYLFKGLISLHRLDDAFDLAAPGPENLRTIEGSWLFGPGMEAAQRDPRFWPLAARLGLVRYWRTRGAWPDFCSEPHLPFNCAIEAARVSTR